MFSVIIIDLITCVITIIMIIIIMIIMIIMCVIIVKILHRWYVQSGAGDVPHGPQRNWACNAYIHIYIYIIYTYWGLAEYGRDPPSLLYPEAEGAKECYPMRVQQHPLGSLPPTPRRRPQAPLSSPRSRRRSRPPPRPARSLTYRGACEITKNTMTPGRS